jgi:hypothetical protein
VKRATTVLLAAAAAVAGCSAIGLTDDLAIATCRDREPGFCEDLNDLSPTGDDCLRWGCDAETGRCAVLPADRDFDGHPAPGCGLAGDVEDCDDGDPANTPGAAELCDGRDNDCDGVVDEGAYSAARTFLGAVDGSPMVAASSVAFDGAGRAVAVGLGGFALDQPAAVTAPEGLATAGVGSILGFEVQGSARDAVRASAVAAAALEDSFVVAAATASYGCERVVLGELDTTSLAVHFDSAEDAAHFEGAPGDRTGLGFPDTDGSDCLEDREVRGLRLAATQDEILAAFLTVEPGSERGLCASADTLPPPAPVLLVYARRRGGAASGLARREVEAAVELETTVDDAPPALLAVGEGRWLVAVTDAAGDVALHGVRRERVDEGTTRRLETGLLHTVSAGGGPPLGHLALAYGPPGDDEAATVALAFRRGCRGAAAELMLLTLEWSSSEATGRLTPLAGPAPLGPDDDEDRTFPAPAFLPGSGEWLAVWVRGRGAIAAARLDAAGRRIADDLDVLLGDPGESATPLDAAPAVVPLSTGGAGVVSFLAAGEPPGLWGARFECDEP